MGQTMIINFKCLEMKNLVTFLMLTFLLNVLSCQSKDDVPDAVKMAFKQKYPKENDPDWHVDQNGNFESNFKKDGEHYRADFSPEGSWIETERSIKKSDLPEAVKDKLKSDYEDFEIVEIEETDHHSKGLFYDVELKKNGEKQDVEFLENGQVIN